MGGTKSEWVMMTKSIDAFPRYYNGIERMEYFGRAAPRAFCVGVH